jgi:ABC-type lipoprotein export system ATPase subunit
MVLLSVEDVTKHYRHGRREFLALRSVSIEVAERELVVILGARKSGRSTLLRIAGGLERPDSGTARFAGRDLSRASDVVGREIAYCHLSFPAVEGEHVLDHVALPLLARRRTMREARDGAERALERACVLKCAAMEPRELNAVERLRVAVARGLASGPRVLVVDDAGAGVGPAQADGLLCMLSSLVHDDGLAVLISSDDATSVAGAERVYTLEAGTVRGEAQAPHAQVFPLRAARAAGDARSRRR